MPSEVTAFNPFDPRILENPYPFYEELRREDPVCFVPGMAVRVITRYADNKFALTNPALFSSAHLADMFKGEYDPVPEPGILMQSSDPPEHTRLRRLISQAFTPKAVEDLRPAVEGFVDDAIARMRVAAEFDFNELLGQALPVQTFFTMAGVPQSLHAQCKAWSDASNEAFRYTVGAQTPDPETHARLRRMIDEYGQFLRDLVADREANPSHDLATGLVQALDKDDRLTEVEVRKLLGLLVSAGTESTEKLLANMVLAFARHPDQYRRVVQERSLIPSAVKEVLRYDGAALHMGRRVTEDVELSGTVLPAGSDCMLAFGAANHDPDEFDDPEAFDVMRDPKGVLGHHMGFGYGVHRCLGAHLATLQAETVLAKLADAFPDGWTCDPDKIVRDGSFFVRGPVRLIVAPN